VGRASVAVEDVEPAGQLVALLERLGRGVEQVDAVALQEPILVARNVLRDAQRERRLGERARGGEQQNGGKGFEAGGTHKHSPSREGIRAALGTGWSWRPGVC